MKSTYSLCIYNLNWSAWTGLVKFTLNWYFITFNWWLIIFINFLLLFFLFRNIVILFYFLGLFLLWSWLCDCTISCFFFRNSSFLSWLSESSTFKRCVTCQKLSAIISLRFFLNNHVAFISYELTIWPVSSLKLWKYE